MRRLLFAIILSLPVFAAAEDYIVKFKGTGIRSSQTAQLESLGLQVTDRHAAGSLVQVEIADQEANQKLAQIYKMRNVEYVVKSFKLYTIGTPAKVSDLREQWAIGKVQAPKAWEQAGNKGNRRVIVAVIDTGVDYNHESLKANMVPGYDFKQNDNDPMDETSSNNPGHGTHCAGIVGATGEVTNGTIGLSPLVSIMPLRFLGADGSGDLMAGIKAIDHAIAKGAKVISASWGAKVGASQAAPLIEAVKRASDAGVIFVSAAGNDGASNDTVGFYPANAKFENTITVAASDKNDAKPSWSNYGRAVVDVASPGDQIMSTIPGNKYMDLRGTSMATPLVSGLVALLASQKSDITGAQAKSLMQQTGAKVAIETACNCRVDAGNAMEALKSNALVVVPAAATLAPNTSAKFSGFLGSAPYQYKSSNTAIADIDASGNLSAKSVGEVTVTVTDANGKSATSLAIRVADKAPDNGGGSCPIGDQAMCDILCGIMPDLPFCSGGM